MKKDVTKPWLVTIELGEGVSAVSRTIERIAAARCHQCWPPAQVQQVTQRWVDVQDDVATMPPTRRQLKVVVGGPPQPRTVAAGEGRAVEVLREEDEEDIDKHDPKGANTSSICFRTCGGLCHYPSNGGPSREEEDKKTSEWATHFLYGFRACGELCHYPSNSKPSREEEYIAKNVQIGKTSSIFYIFSAPAAGSHILAGRLPPGCRS